MPNKTSPNPLQPPRPETPDGRTRRVGVEIEFAGLPVRDAAALVLRHFGGDVHEHNVHRIKIEDTPLGTFTVELDAQMVHPDDRRDDPVILSRKLDARAREALGHAVSGLVPVEIVTPPIPWNRLGELDGLFDALRQCGAEGTDANPLFGFGLHLNPEVAEETAGYALNHLKAYVILADWLRDTIDVDATRKLLPHIDPFPEPYIRKVLAPAYAPDLPKLMSDYVHHNPTRNRGLDMLALFRHLDEDGLLELLDDASLIKGRPTFHYRLPNASLSDPNWNAVVEWNRWVEVERLAHDEGKLADRAAAYLGYLNQPLAERWLDNLKRWLDS